MKTGSDAITRLISRSLGYTEVIQPLVHPTFSPQIFNDNITNPHGFNDPKKATITETENNSANDKHMPQSTQDKMIRSVSTVNPADNIPPVQLLPEDLLPTRNDESKQLKKHHTKKRPIHQEVTIAQGDEPENKTLLNSGEPVKGKSMNESEHLVIPETQQSFPENIFIVKKGQEVGKRAVNILKNDNPSEVVDMGSASENHEPKLLLDPVTPVSPGGIDGIEKQIIEPVNTRELVRPEIHVDQVTSRQGEAQTVQVTIGRVDVRAVMHQTIQQPAPSSSPVLSLDEYLKMRERGER